MTTPTYRIRFCMRPLEYVVQLRVTSTEWTDLATYPTRQMAEMYIAEATYGDTYYDADGRRIPPHDITL